jgi:hypothetical protein
MKFNHFPDINERIERAAADMVAETANAIEADVSGTWSYTNIPVRVVNRTKTGQKIQAWVSAGSNKRFYAAFLENGTITVAPNPAMTPAAERHGSSFISRAKALERLIF